jgi:hypothetical protein
VIGQGNDKREAQRLLDTLLAVLLRCKDTIIAMKVLNFSVGSIIKPLLETLLAHNGLVLTPEVLDSPPR